MSKSAPYEYLLYRDKEALSGSKVKEMYASIMGYKQSQAELVHLSWTFPRTSPTMIPLFLPWRSWTTIMV